MGVQSHTKNMKRKIRVATVEESRPYLKKILKRNEEFFKKLSEM